MKDIKIEFNVKKSLYAIFDSAVAQISQTISTPTKTKRASPMRNEN